MVACMRESSVKNCTEIDFLISASIRVAYLLELVIEFSDKLFSADVGVLRVRSYGLYIEGVR